MFEYSGNAHMHTPYSDGTKWHAEIASDAIKAGLDFVIVTDHNVWVGGVDGIYEKDGGRVLLLVGEEVHDMRRQPQANHFLAYGAERELSPFARDPQTLINKTVESGGFGFLAHPFDPAAPAFGEVALGWQNWDLDGYAGLELWNYMSNFKGLLRGRLKALRAALNPAKFIVAPQGETLSKWDELLAQGKRVSVIGGSDAHGMTYRMGPISRVVFPYDFLFRAVNTHILVAEELSGDLENDKALVLAALKKGNSWVGYDMAHPTKGFRFSGQSRDKGIVGDVIRMDAGATLQVKAPAKCHIRIIREGEVVAEARDEIGLTHIPIETGAYRVECAIHFQGRKRGWIYSNPIYLE